MNTGIGLRLLPGRAGDVDERIRDPPPPANFPAVCPRNRKLKSIIARLDKNLFERNGLHNIPYRDTALKNLPTLVYDGEKWPESDQEGGLPVIDVEGGDIIDIWTQRAQEREAAERSQVRYHEISHDSLKDLIRAIKYPVEMRLLPHIIREWHRQGFPITMVDAERIARFATRHNEVDVVLQMIRPEVYGLYYDKVGIREVIRGMAKRASFMAAGDDRKQFTPEDMLRRAPEILRCSLGTDSSRMFRDPVVLGTQLWGFVSRFNNDEAFRSKQSLSTMCALTEMVVEAVSEDNLSTPPTGDQAISDERRRQFAFQIKAQVADYTPVLYALRQIIKIFQSPYRACLVAFQGIDMLEESTQKTRNALADFLDSRLQTLYKAPSFPNASHSPGRGRMDPVKLGWARMNHGLGSELRRGAIQLQSLTDWQWSLLTQYTNPQSSGSGALKTPHPNSTSHYLPVYAIGTLKVVERKMAEWRHILNKERISVKSEFNINIQEYESKL